jgi:hypothetical protein
MSLISRYQNHAFFFSKPNEIKNGPWANVSTRVNNVES